MDDLGQYAVCHAQNIGCFAVIHHLLGKQVCYRKAFIDLSLNDHVIYFIGSDNIIRLKNIPGIILRTFLFFFRCKD